jgi:hypothetical protein
LEKKRVKDFSFTNKHVIIRDSTIAIRENGKELTLKAVSWINLESITTGKKHSDFLYSSSNHN